MEEKEKDVSFFKTLVQLGQAAVSIFSNIFNLAVLEMRLAGRSLVIMLGLFLFMGFILMTIWLSLMAMFGFWLSSFQLSWPISLSLVLLLNVILAIIIVLFMLRCQRNMTFRATRKQIRLLNVNENTRELQP